MANNQNLQAKFDAFHAKKPWIYEQFCFACDTLIKRGFTQASSTMVLEFVRMHHMMETGEHLPIPNDYRAYYAKKWLIEHKGDSGVPWRFFRMTARYRNGTEAEGRSAGSPEAQRDVIKLLARTFSHRKPDFIRDVMQSGDAVNDEDD